MKRHLALLATIAITAGAEAATRTYVSLAGRGDSLPRLGRPGVTVQVEAVTQAEAILVMNELHREMARLVHTRELAADEDGDYQLKVMLELPVVDRALRTIPFTAVLTSVEGERLWRTEGRSETTDPVASPSPYVSIGRNVVSALIHDGWLAPRYDPNDPPPDPPQIRKDDRAH